MQEVVPDKLYFRIGEVAELAGLKPSVLRFWETQFPLLLPHKTTSGQRRYSNNQVLQVLEVRRLLYEEKLTIAGAQKRLTQPGQNQITSDSGQEKSQQELLKDIKIELEEIRQILNK